MWTSLFSILARRRVRSVIIVWGESAHALGQCLDADCRRSASDRDNDER
jgi:hypothetical protein